MYRKTGWRTDVRLYNAVNEVKPIIPSGPVVLTRRNGKVIKRKEIKK